MAVQLERYIGNGSILNNVAETDSKKNRSTSWNGMLRDCMEAGEPWEVTRTLAASVSNRDYKAGSYNKNPLIPPIINPPSEVTERGPNAPYYDARLTGGPLIRPDARLYTYDTAPSYMRAIVDYNYGAPKNASNYPKDSEYNKVFSDLRSGKGYKGHFMSPSHPDYWNEWGDYFTRVARAAENKTATLGAYTVNDAVAAGGDEDMRQKIEQALRENPDQTAVVIDGEIMLIPKAMATQSSDALTQNTLPIDMTAMQMQMGAALGTDMAAYQRRLAAGQSLTKI